MTKRIISVVVVCALLFSLTISSVAFAAPATTESQPDISISAQIDQIQNDYGLNKEDATYYAKLDNMLKEMKQNNEKIDLDSSDIKDLSDNDVTKDVKSFREKVLSKDKAALKKAVKSLTYIKGTDETRKLMEKYRNMESYEIQYPDGSSVKVSGKLQKKDDNNNLVTPSAAYSEAYMRTTYANGNGNWSDTETWQFKSAAGIANSSIYAEFNITNYANPGTVTMTYARGGQSYLGVVQISNSNGGTITRLHNDQSTQKPAEACNQVVFYVTGSFSAGAYGLSLSVSAGAGWTQYTYVRVYGNGVIGGYVGTYV